MSNFGDKFNEFTGEIIHVVLKVGFGLSVLFGLAVLGMQTFQWAKTGVWPGVPLSDLFMFLGVDLSPIYYPKDWMGLASLTAWLLDLPVSLVVPLIGGIVYLYVYLFIVSFFER